MSFRTQRLVNRYPLWTKARRDSSSLTSRLMNTFAEGLEESSITAKRFIDSFYLSTRRLGRSFLYDISLEGDDILLPTESSNGFTWQYPTITGTIGIDSYSVERVSSLTDLLQGITTRLTLKESFASGNRIVWESSDPYTYNSLLYSDRLWINIENSTFYVNKTPSNDRDKSGLSRVTITGFDEDYNTITDSIEVLDDGIYITNFAFSDEITQVLFEGFDGDITITLGPYNLPYEPDPYRILIFDDLEGPLQIELESDTPSFINLRTNRLKLGRQYRKPGIEDTFNTEELLSIVLLDTTSTEIEAVSISVSPDNTFLYAIDTTGFLHIYDLILPEFPAPITEETVDTYVELHPLSNYAKYGRSEYIWTRFARLRFPITLIQIKRTDPDGIITYLQSDKETWGASVANISYPITGKQSIDQWQDFRFTTEYNKLGIWEYNCMLRTPVNETTYTTMVCCGSITALRSIDTGIALPELLYFADNGDLIVEDSTLVYRFQENKDLYLIEEESSRVFLSDNYDEVLVS